MWRTLSQRLKSEREPGERGKLTVAAILVRAPAFASAGLGIAIAAQAAVIAVSLWSEMAGADVHSAPTTAAHVRAPGGVPLAAIMAAHLFGSAPLGMTAAEARAASRAPLILTGIIAMGDPHDGFAIVGNSAASARAVYVGSEAAPGTVLTDVYPQWVVLQRGRDRLVLHLPRDDMVAAAGGPQMMERGAPLPQAEDTDDTGETASAEDFSPPPLSDGAAILRSFALRPAKVNGEQGERIMGTGVNGKVLASLGLSPGDVITQINGVPVGTGNTPNLMTVLQSGNATLEVVKNGEETSVTLGPNTMADAATLYRQADPN